MCVKDFQEDRELVRFSERGGVHARVEWRTRERIPLSHYFSTFRRKDEGQASNVKNQGSRQGIFRSARSRAHVSKPLSPTVTRAAQLGARGAVRVGESVQTKPDPTVPLRRSLGRGERGRGQTFRYPFITPHKCSRTPIAPYPGHTRQGFSVQDYSSVPR